MTLQLIITFLVVLPIAILIQFVRSQRFPREQRSVKADLIEAAGLALGMSLSVESGTFFPHWSTWVSFIFLFAIVYFPVCFFADWIRKRSRHDA
jgi:hypothetical protein